MPCFFCPDLFAAKKVELDKTLSYISLLKDHLDPQKFQRFQDSLKNKNYKDVFLKLETIEVSSVSPKGLPSLSLEELIRGWFTNDKRIFFINLCV